MSEPVTLIPISISILVDKRISPGAVALNIARILAAYPKAHWPEIVGVAVPSEPWYAWLVRGEFQEIPIPLADLVP